MVSYRSSILIAWLILSFLEGVFSNADGTAANSDFSAAGSHVSMALGYSCIAIFLLVLFVRRYRSIRLDAPIKYQIILYSYFLLTGFWSNLALVSFGQAIYSVYGLFFAFSIGYACAGRDLLSSVTEFIKLWFFMLLIAYLVEAFFIIFYSGVFRLVPLDEKALISVVLIILAFSFKISVGRIRNIILWFMFIFGLSFSSILSSLVFFLSRIRSHIRIFLLLCFMPSFWYLYRLLLAGDIKIYSKSIDYIYTGSGRFDLYSVLMNKIIDQNISLLIFGNGYMSERYALSASELTWSIDAHNNILQSLWGVGVLGTLIMFKVWRSFIESFSSYKTLVTRTQMRTLNLSVFAFVAFGLTSSHFFSRPSLSAVFITSLCILLGNVSRKT
jgi:hypothetical protein